MKVFNPEYLKCTLKNYSQFFKNIYLVYSIGLRHDYRLGHFKVSMLLSANRLCFLSLIIVMLRPSSSINFHFPTHFCNFSLNFPCLTFIIISLVIIGILTLFKEIKRKLLYIIYNFSCQRISSIVDLSYCITYAEKLTFF